MPFLTNYETRKEADMQLSNEKMSNFDAVYAHILDHHDHEIQYILSDEAQKFTFQSILCKKKNLKHL